MRRSSRRGFEGGRELGKCEAGLTSRRHDGRPAGVLEIVQNQHKLNCVAKEYSHKVTKCARNHAFCAHLSFRADLSFRAERARSARAGEESQSSRPRG